MVVDIPLKYNVFYEYLCINKSLTLVIILIIVSQVDDDVISYTLLQSKYGVVDTGYGQRRPKVCVGTKILWYI